MYYCMYMYILQKLCTHYYYFMQAGCTGLQYNGHSLNCSEKTTSNRCSIEVNDAVGKTRTMRHGTYGKIILFFGSFGHNGIMRLHHFHTIGDLLYSNTLKRGLPWNLPTYMQLPAKHPPLSDQNGLVILYILDAHWTTHHAARGYRGVKHFFLDFFHEPSRLSS